MPTIKEAVTEELMKRGLKIYLGGYHDFTLDELKRLGFTMAELYASIAERVNPEWKQLISSDREAFNKFWIEIDAEVEGHGYYMLGERHDTPLIKARPDAPISNPEPSMDTTGSSFNSWTRMLQSRDREIQSLKERVGQLEGTIAGVLNNLEDAKDALKKNTLRGKARQ